MARNVTLVKLLDDLRAEARLSLNPAHNSQARDGQVKQLQRKQEWLWREFDWPHLRVTRDIPVAAGQRYYELPEDIDLERIEKLEIFIDSVWVPLAPEINNEHYTAWNSDLDERSWPPRRWNLAEDDDLEIWPVPDTDAVAATMEGYVRVTGIRRLRPLVNDDHRCDIDSNLIIGYLAAEMLAASGAKDAKVKQDEANALFMRLRGQLTVSRKFRLFGTGEPKLPRRPAVAFYRPPST